MISFSSRGKRLEIIIKFKQILNVSVKMVRNANKVFYLEWFQTKTHVYRENMVSNENKEKSSISDP